MGPGEEISDYQEVYLKFMCFYTIKYGNSTVKNDEEQRVPVANNGEEVLGSNCDELT